VKCRRRIDTTTVLNYGVDIAAPAQIAEGRSPLLHTTIAPSARGNFT